MAQIINTNIMSLNSQRNLNRTQETLAVSLQRLSSGLRINSAKDDAAGLAIAERFSTQIRGVQQAIRNANDGVSVAQTAEGSLGEVNNALQRIRELAVQSANATNSTSDRAALNAEVQQLVGEITRIGDTASFNGLKLLDGSYTSQSYQVGSNVGETISISLVDARAVKLGATTKTSTSGVLSSASLTTGITLNSTAISTSSATSITDVVNAINAKSGTTGVEAQRASVNTVDTGAYTTAAVSAATITINGASITVGVADTIGTVTTNINAVSTSTGVTATNDGTNITLTNSTGGDIIVGDDATQNILGHTSITATAATFKAGVQLSSKLGSTITVAGTLATTLSLGSATAVDYKLSASSVDSVSNANTAIRAADFALNQINNSRAELGAIQRRFESIISGLAINNENLTASRSRIQDADFAAETASLTRAQILQQAGVAILAQANAIPQNVLALLK
jgi:flagellin